MNPIAYGGCIPKPIKENYRANGRCCEEFQNAIDEDAFVSGEDRDGGETDKFYIDGDWHSISDDWGDDQTRASFRIDFCPFCGKKTE